MMVIKMLNGIGNCNDNGNGNVDIVDIVDNDNDIDNGIIIIKL